MKRFTYAAIAIGLLSSAASSAQVEWRGGLCITDQTPVCANDGWAVGQCYFLRYLPANIGDNGNKTRLTFLAQHFAEQFTLDPGNLVGTTFQAVQGTSIGRFGFQSPVTMRIWPQSPQSPTETTRSITLQTRIRDISGLIGCNIDFQGAAVLMPAPAP